MRAIERSDIAAEVTTPASQFSTTPAELLVHDFNVKCEPDSDIDDLISELSNESDSFAGEMTAAFEWASENLYDESVLTVAKLRLSKGFSQKQLADKVGTSQSQLSRIESGSQDPTYASMRRLAEALGVDLSVVASAIEGSQAC